MSAHPAPLAARNTGFGLGLRTPHYADFLAQSQPLDWLEIITDNFLVEGGKPLAMLDAIRRDYPMAMHGVAMSIGAAQGIDRAYLRQVKALADRIEPLWVSDHLCWIGPGPQQLHDLYPIPYTDEAARHIITQIQRAQEILGRRLVIENVSSYIHYRHSGASEWQFLSHIANAADCLLLVDVNNIYVSSVNHGFDPLDYLNALPAQRVQQIHLAGHANHGDYIIDTHDHPVAQPVWDLYARACQRFGSVATMIERDDHIPPLAELLEEMTVARRIAALHTPQAAGALAATAVLATRADLPSRPTASALSGAPLGVRADSAVQSTGDVRGDVPGDATQLQHLQNLVAQRILSPIRNPPNAADLTADSNEVWVGHFEVYHHAYRARLADALADTFAKTYLFMGSDTFDTHARDYAVAQPPLRRSLNRYGHRFSNYLATLYPANPELVELAQLDWDLRTRFDSADAPALDVFSAQTDGPKSWLSVHAPLHASVVLRAIRTNVVQIWNAIDADADVPEAVPLDAPVTLLVWRKGHQPHFKTLDAGQAGFVQLLGAGASIQEACETLEAAQALPAAEELSTWLRELLNDGLVAQAAHGAAPKSDETRRTADA